MRHNSGLAFVLITLLAPTLHAKPHAKSKRPDLVMGASMRGVLWVDLQVAVAASRPLYLELARRTKLTISDVKPMPKKELLGKLKSGKVNLAFLSLVEFLEASEMMELVPLCRPSVVGRDDIRLTLLVRRDSGLKRLSDLKDKVIGLHGTRDLEKIYLRVLMARNKLGEPRSFFREMRLKKKPQSAVLEVLLGEADAALVSDLVVTVMAQLNPQIKRKLMALHTSVSYPQPPLVVRKSVPKDMVKRLLHTMVNLHNDSKGKQLMLVFRLNRLIPIQDGDYDGLKELWQEHQKLQPVKKNE